MKRPTARLGTAAFQGWSPGEEKSIISSIWKEFTFMKHLRMLPSSLIASVWLRPFPSCKLISRPMRTRCRARPRRSLAHRCAEYLIDPCAPVRLDRRHIRLKKWFSVTCCCYSWARLLLSLLWFFNSLLSCLLSRVGNKNTNDSVGRCQDTIIRVMIARKHTYRFTITARERKREYPIAWFLSTPSKS